MLELILCHQSKAVSFTTTYLVVLKRRNNKSTRKISSKPRFYIYERSLLRRNVVQAAPIVHGVENNPYTWDYSVTFFEQFRYDYPTFVKIKD